MKNKSCILLLIISAIMMAQKVAFAPEIGVSLSNIHTNETKGTSNKSGLMLGVVANVQIKKNFYLVPGLFFIQKGAQKTVLSETAEINITRTINYLELPVDALYRFSLRKGDGIFLSTGMYVATPISGQSNKNILIYGGDIQKETKKMEFGNNANQVKRFDYGLCFGIGYENPLGIYIKGRYELGLQNVVNVKYLYNRSVMVTLGYIIKHKP
ncbi:porin family protein [Chryseobacterium sp. ISL-6]|uniref:porin family protein n=1 Tax=Chryseobacterium sp. ISL-6 TaxID=2819143 RepID=UPI001BE590FA|nr:porin family protein [Chryseobacterium sp. ISL-6]MBT2620585.1 PorT family protein [Chryseobacterium sp. ISL-6]